MNPENTQAPETIVLISTRGQLTVAPFSLPKLHYVAELLGLISFDRNHYDIPVYRFMEFEKKIEMMPEYFLKLNYLDFLQFLIDVGQHDSIGNLLDTNPEEPYVFARPYIPNKVEKPVTNSLKYSIKAVDQKC